MLIEEILRQVIKTQNSAFFYTPPGYSGDSSYFFKNPVIFIKQKDIWLMPRISSGILSGIYRNCFIESNNNVKETHLYKNDLLNADEIMLTNSVRGKVKVNKLFGDFDTLLKEYS